MAWATSSLPVPVGPRRSTVASEGPWSRRSGSYRQSRHLTLSREVRRSKNSTYTVYPVRLQAEGFVVDIDAPRSYEIARRRAEEVAKFLDLGVDDRSTGQSVVREAGKLDASLRDQAQSEPHRQALQPMPAGCRIKMRRLEDGVVFELPPRKATLSAKAAKALGVGMLIIAAVTAPFVLFALGEGIDAGLGPLLFSVFWVVAALAIFRSARARGTGVESVFASPQRLVLETPSFAGERRSSISADKLEELVLVGGEGALAPPMAVAAAAAKVSGGGAAPDGAGGKAAPEIPAGIATMLAAAGLVPARTIVARSDAVTLQFGGGLDKHEIEWLHEMLQQILTR